jgi:hypothetical protein
MSGRMAFVALAVTLALGIVGAASASILLGLGGAAMAGDSGENHQDNTNTGGFVPPNSAGKCWTNAGQANYRWADCPRANTSLPMRSRGRSR